MFPELADLEVLHLPIEEREGALRAYVAHFQPNLVWVEFFPFGSHELAGEILGMIAEARRQRPRVKVVSSIRDLLGFAESGWLEKRDQIRKYLEEHIDHLLIHGDATIDNSIERDLDLAGLSTSFQYTGYVVTKTEMPVGAKLPMIVVSVGGGKDGLPLIIKILEALRPSAHLLRSYQLRVATGPFSPEDPSTNLAEYLGVFEHITIDPFIPELARTIAEAALSISMGGYNTITDILQTDTPALIIPRTSEPEQAIRARHFQRLGAMSMLEIEELTVESLRNHLELLLTSTQYNRRKADLGGATRSAQLIMGYLGETGSR